MAGASGKKLDETYRLAWVRGLKTTYYLRTLAATSAEKSTGRGGELNAVSRRRGGVRRAWPALEPEPQDVPRQRPDMRGVPVGPRIPEPRRDASEWRRRARGQRGRGEANRTTPVVVGGGSGSLPKAA